MSLGVTVTLPFLAAILYGLSMLLLKRASGFSVGLTRTLFIANWIAAGFALLLLPLQQEVVQWNQLHLPLLGGLFFFLGQALTFIAIRMGDVSVVTPAMGLKVVFVAWLSVSLFGMPLSTALIAGALLAMVGVVLIGLSDWTHPGRLWTALAAAILSAFFFSVSDILVSQWAPRFGDPAYVVVLLWAVAIYSLLLIPFFSGPLRGIEGAAWPWVGFGAALLGIQAVLFNAALAIGDPTRANILYSSRSVWALLFVLLLGPLLGNWEGRSGIGKMILRVTAVIALFLAIILAVAGG